MKYISSFAACCVFIATGLCLGKPLAPDEREVNAEAPPNLSYLKRTIDGGYYVPSPLKKEYDKLLERVRGLEADLDAERVSGPEVLKELSDLKPKLDALRLEIEKAKVLVSALKTHTQTEEITFDLGPERLLVIDAARIKIEGWDKPQVKCVLTKTVLTVKDVSADSTLNAIKLEHRHGVAPKIVGESAAKRAQNAPEHNNPGMRRRRNGLGDAELALFSAFQDKEIDTVAVAGMAYENQFLFVRIKSPGGGSSGETEYQRHADLTVYVPSCKAIALCGCSSLDVKGVRASLILSHSGGWGGDEIPDDTRSVRNLHGPLVSDGVDLDLLEDIDGPVTITTGKQAYSESLGELPSRRLASTTPPGSLTCRRIYGDLTARLLQVNLNLEAVGGSVDVLNDFGNTTWTIAAPPALRAHRVISQSGRVVVNISPNMLEHMPLTALTACGIVRSDEIDPVVGEASAYASRPLDPDRTWYGLQVPSHDRTEEQEIEAAARLNAAIHGLDRTPGIDLISRAGTVVLHFEKKN